MIHRFFSSVSKASNKPFRVCIVGTGPAGFYTADSLIKMMGEKVSKIDFLESLPVPYGLVRFGVAPDHPEVKNVTSKFDSLLSDSRSRFFGNVTLGRDISVQDLQQRYDAIVLSNGCSQDYKLNIPGEEGPGVMSARSFTNWYNGHPDFQDFCIDLSKSENIVIVGNGNVAVDVARILLKPIPELEKTDITEPALSALRNSVVKNVHLVARRGPVQAAWTTAELRELYSLENVNIKMIPEETKCSDVDLKEMEKSRSSKRSYQILQNAMNNPKQSSCEKTLHLRFLAAPNQINRNDSGNVTGLKIEKTRLEGDPGQQKAVGLGVYEDIPASYVFRSIRFKGEPIPNVPWNPKTNTFYHDKGKLQDENRNFVPKLYCSGWAKRGANGVILSNILDSKETAMSMTADYESSINNNNNDNNSMDVADLSEFLREKGIIYVSKDGWGKIAKEEQKRGQDKGKTVSEKLISRNEMLAIAN